MGLENVLTNKQADVLGELAKEDWFIAILHGAIRSGKTFVNNIQFLLEVRRVAEQAKKQDIQSPMYILAGYSMSSIQDNILNELSNTFGLEFKFDKYNAFMLMGVKIIQTTHGNIQGIGRIRGMTAHGAYINEASLANESVFEEIKGRCSGVGARILADTNPDQPEHWLKKNYIDKAETNKDIKAFQFILDDNTFLDERYVQNLKNATPSGMFFDRAINGMWVTGKGAIYSDFDKSKHYVSGNKLPAYFDEFFIGLDFGYEHWGSCVLFGKHGEAYYLIKEISAQHEQIEFWIEQLQDLSYEYGMDIPIYCDSARPDHVAKIGSVGLNALFANKSVLSGIETVAGLLKTDRLFFNEYGVSHFKDEIYNYVWDSKTGKPVKMHDDTMDAIRYALHSHIYNPISITLGTSLF